MYFTVELFLVSCKLHQSILFYGIDSSGVRVFNHVKKKSRHTEMFQPQFVYKFIKIDFDKEANR